MTSSDSLSKEAGMTSSGDDFCGVSRITSATSAAVTTSRVDEVDELIRVMGECNKPISR